MLCELRVENLLLIERAQLRLAPGLNVLTGETGAGKTVLAHALDLLLGGRGTAPGGRGRAGIVRPGAPEAYVEGVFDLPDHLRGELGERLPDDAEEVVLARRVGADGRTRAYVNGRTATVADLRELGEGLIVFYGQHEHRRLTLAAAQLEILDGFCGPGQAERRASCAAAFRAVRRVEAELQELRGLDGAQGLELLEHELAEIEQAAPDQDEHERLLGDRERLRQLDALRAAVGGASEALAPDGGETPGAGQQIADGAARLEGMAGVDPRLDALAERARALAVEVEDVASELRGYGEALDGEDGGLEAVEERLAALERVLRKHGGTIAAVLEQAERMRARRSELAGADAERERVAEALREARAELDGHIEALRRARARAAPRLAAAVRAELASLAMAGASFEIELSPGEPGPTGGDSVQFTIAPNPGVAPGPLREIASGGELSRVMLALSTAALGDDDGARAGGGRQAPQVGSQPTSQAGGARPTLVFDEIDAGIGGHTARAVGERLRRLGDGGQVLCITHLPQIASLASRHFSVVKDTSADPARATVVELKESEVVGELVRMLGAEDADPAARRHARELRRAA